MDRGPGGKDPISLVEFLEVKWQEKGQMKIYDFGSDMTKTLLMDISLPTFC